MAELSVLHSEPRYKVTSFVTELIGRRQETIQAMRPALLKLLAAFAEQMDMLRLNHLGLDLTILKFKQPTWTKDGTLLLSFQQMEAHDDEPAERYHVDELVREILDREPHLLPMQDELSQFFSAFVDQFSVLKKHYLLDLTRVTFPALHWLPNGILECSICYDGKPLAPRTAGLD